MRRLAGWLILAALVSFGVLGCGDSDGARAQTDGGQSSEVESTNGTPGDDSLLKGDSLVSVESNRATTQGRWLLYISRGGNDLPFLLIEISKKDQGGYEAKLLAATDQLPKVTLKSAQVDATSAKLTFDVQGSLIDFEGSLAGGVLRGNAIVPDKMVYEPALMIATEDDSLENATIAKSGGIEAIEKLDQKDPGEGIKRLAEDYPDSLLTPIVLQQIIVLAAKQRIDEAAFKKEAALYVKLVKRWGQRMELLAHINISIILVSTRYRPESALESLAEAEALLTKQSDTTWKPVIERVTNEAHIVQALAWFDDKKQDVRKKGAVRIRALKKKNPFNPHLTHALAVYAEEQNQVDEAIAEYSELAALPMMESQLIEEWTARNATYPLPSGSLAALWKKKHGNTEKLEEHVHVVYEDRIHSFADTTVKPRAVDGGNRVVLCELMTGTQCPPCVAADVATGALEKTYRRSELIVLRYHQHVPGPDPLANADAEARFGYYSLRGTPSLLVNGKSFPRAPGFMPQAVEAYKELREVIDLVLKEKSTLSLTLSARAENGILSISTEVDGLEEGSGSVRLRLALAEEKTNFNARNGIRVHEMVVRLMPGGPAGIEPRDGKLNIEQTIDLAEFKQQLVDYLAEFERGSGQNFRAKPLELRKLYLVAMVQDDESKEVLQAASIPVSGNLEYAKGPQLGVSPPKPTVKPTVAPKPSELESLKQPDTKKESQKESQSG